MPDYKKLYEEEVEQRERQESVRREQEYDDYLRREEERRSRIARWEYDDNFEAANWMQALRQNIRRLKRELKDSLQWVKEARDKGNPLTDFDFNNLAFWRKEIRANQLACEYLDEEMRHIAPIINKLQAKIDKLERRARVRAVKRVQETTGDSASIEALIDGEPSDILQW
jgi:hypothetical protein